MNIGQLRSLLSGLTLHWFADDWKTKWNWPASKFTLSEAEFLACLSVSDAAAAFSQSLQLVALDPFEAPGAVAYGVGTNGFGPARRKTLRSQWVALPCTCRADAEGSSSVRDRLDWFRRTYRDAKTILLDVQSEDGKLRSCQGAWNTHQESDNSIMLKRRGNFELKRKWKWFCFCYLAWHRRWSWTGRKVRFRSWWTGRWRFVYKSEYSRSTWVCPAVSRACRPVRSRRSQWWARTRRYPPGN